MSLQLSYSTVQCSAAQLQLHSRETGVHVRFDSITVTDTVLLQSCAFTFLAVLSVLVVKAAAIAAMSIKSVQYITNEEQIVQRGTIQL